MRIYKIENIINQGQWTSTYSFTEELLLLPGFHAVYIPPLFGAEEVHIYDTKGITRYVLRSDNVVDDCWKRTLTILHESGLEIKIEEPKFTHDDPEVMARYELLHPFLKKAKIS